MNWESENAKLYHPTFVVERSLELLANATALNATTTALDTTTMAALSTSTAAAIAAAAAVANTTTTTAIPLNITQLDANVTQPDVDDGLSTFDEQRYQYMYTYAIIMLLVFYLVFQRAIAFSNMCLKASRKLHDKLFRGIIRAPMHFYNSNSSGRIMNRFSKDISNVDQTLPIALFDSFTVCLQ